MKLNLGCGSHVVDGWINVDYALGARLAKSKVFRLLNKKIKFFKLDWDEKIFIHNLNKTFPWNDNSIEVIYTSHTLEHFSRAEGIRFLKECHRVLCENGVIRLVVPDLFWVVSEYWEGRLRGDEFIERLGVLSPHYGNRLKTKLALFTYFPHKCMYDTPTLLTILKQIGFDAVIKQPFLSDIDRIDQLEIKSRTENAVIVEGEKL